MNATKKDFISLQLASDRRKTDALKKKIQENIESIQRIAMMLLSSRATPNVSRITAISCGIWMSASRC